MSAEAERAELVEWLKGQGFTDDYYAKIAPSIVYEWSDKMNFQLGLVQGLTGDKGAGLKFETWLTY